ncbi:hypothetical protein [Lachnoclostridium sp.]|nr:hypothetical protein [Lachnoclostridium sp.]
MKFPGHLYQSEWPSWDKEKTIESTIEIAVQLNGKVKVTVAIAPGKKLQ